MKRIDQILYSPVNTLEYLQQLKRALRGVSRDIVDAGLFVPAGGPLGTLESLLSNVPSEDEACTACGGTGLVADVDISGYSVHYTCARCGGRGREPMGWQVRLLEGKEVESDFFSNQGVFASPEEAKEAAEKALEELLGAVLKDPKTGQYTVFSPDKRVLANIVPVFH